MKSIYFQQPEFQKPGPTHSFASLIIKSSHINIFVTEFPESHSHATANVRVPPTVHELCVLPQRRVLRNLGVLEKKYQYLRAQIFLS
jgi:hypothetical protein